MTGYPHGETVTRLRASSTPDPYSGDDVQDWSAPAELAIPGVAVEPIVSRTESAVRPAEQRRLVEIDFRIYVPDPAADVTAADRVRVRGHVCRVVGEPAAWRSPFTGWAPGLVVELTTTEG